MDDDNVSTNAIISQCRLISTYSIHHCGILHYYTNYIQCFIATALIGGKICTNLFMFFGGYLRVVLGISFDHHVCNAHTYEAPTFTVNFKNLEMLHVLLYFD